MASNAFTATRRGLLGFFAAAVPAATVAAIPVAVVAPVPAVAPSNTYSLPNFKAMTEEQKLIWFVDTARAAYVKAQNDGSCALEVAVIGSCVRGAEDDLDAYYDSLP